MKIQSYGVNAINPYKNQQMRTEAVKKTSNSFVDQLEISAQAKDLQGIKSYADERAEKISMIKNQIDTGTYKVDSQKLAKNLLNYYRP